MKRTRSAAPTARVARVLAPAVMLSLLVAAVLGGLWRAGVAVPIPDAIWPAQAIAAHAFLMMVAFMGTLVAAERAVALRHRTGLLVPVLMAASGLAMLAGHDTAASTLALSAALGFTAVNAALYARQEAPHTRLLMVGAGALLVGNLMFAMGSPVAVVAPWWFTFLVVTIAAERLEMTRLLRRRRGASQLLWVCVAVMLAGAAAFAVAPAVGCVIFGAALFALALWLMLFDVARKTLHSHGLARYMAVCLLLGYVWLAVAGVAWAVSVAGLPTRDLALHALGLGFVLSMMLAHAPVIVPALLRVKLAYGPVYYLPPALLHASLLLRFAGRVFSQAAFSAGAAANALALLAFVLTMLGAAWVRRRSDMALVARNPSR